MVDTQRYWDGAQWTEHLQPMHNPAQPVQAMPVRQDTPTQQYPQTQHPQPPQFAAPPGQPPGAQQFNPQQFDGQQFVAGPRKSGMSTWVKLLIVFGLLTPLAIGGCAVLLVAVGSSEDPSSISVDADREALFDDEAVVADKDAEGSAAEPAVAIDGSIGTRDAPYPYSQSVDLPWDSFGDADGSVWATSIGPPRDITAEVLSENPFNNNPPDGVLFVGFDVELTLLEAQKEPLAPGFNFSWEILGGATAAAYQVSTIETDSFGCGVAPGSFDDFSEVFVSGTLTGTVCIPIPEEDLNHPNTQVALHFIGDTRAIFGN